MKLLYLALLQMAFHSYCIAQPDLKTTLRDQHLRGKVRSVTITGSSEYTENYDTSGTLINKGMVRSLPNDSFDHFYSVNSYGPGSGDSTLWWFNKNGKLHMIRRYYNGALSNEMRYSYNDKKQLIAEEDSYYWPHQEVRTQTLKFEYNKTGLLCLVTADMASGQYTPENYPVFYNSYEYFGEAVEGMFWGKAVLHYDEHGNLREQVLYHADEVVGKAACTWDKYGNRTSTTTLGKNNKLMWRTNTTYKYDKQGNWIQKTETGEKGRVLYTTKRTISYY